MYHADTKVHVCNCGQILLNLKVRKEKIYFFLSHLCARKALVVDLQPAVSNHTTTTRLLKRSLMFPSRRKCWGYLVTCNSQQPDSIRRAKYSEMCALKYWSLRRTYISLCVGYKIYPVTLLFMPCRSYFRTQRIGFQGAPLVFRFRLNWLGCTSVGRICNISPIEPRIVAQQKCSRRLQCTWHMKKHIKACAVISTCM